ncbi:hypothetical protein AWB76_03813 [Caballeronia temeraria]|uniref:Uncharacterized protein n=1 Tax=Caballeronia temeraria TaxID=1777137 RepID=A0A158B8C6_9BURK|nr:hypothetical protein [Caballeronia temeraria]SAK66334.1 hypothetical protein AWB76_03813 [Caballeronia temeraria]
MNGNLVIGSAFSYQIEQIEPFVKSLRRYYGGKVVLFVQNLDEATRAFYEHHNIDTHEIAETIDFGTINVMRFQMYHQFLNNVAASQFRKVFLVDTRDVIFQGDPFTNTDMASLYLYAEPEMIGACAVNADWYKQLYGDTGLAEVKNQLIICGGAILGTRDAVLNLIEIFWAELGVLAGNQRFFGKCDQALLNYLAYNKLKNWILGATYSSNVATLHHAKYFKFNSNGQLLNANDEPIPVVHQYDRREWFKDLLLRQV